MPDELTPPDASLALRLVAGDLDALDILFRRYAPELLRLARGLSDCEDDADDVVQDVFVGLRLALGKYEERGSLRHWLRGVTARTALAHRRRHVSRRELSLEVKDHAVASNHTNHDALHEAIGLLPTPMRDVVVLKIIEGYSHAEIASLLGIRAGTSEVRLFRAVRMLRLLLTEAH